MKRFLLTLGATVAGLVALLDFKTQGHPLAASGGLPSAAASGTTSSPAPSTATTPATGSSTPAPRGSTRTVKYTGNAIETRYGVVQVAVTVTGQHIDNASFVRLDAFDQHSQDINSRAAPILLQETITGQSAHIDTVSGATYTSDGYLQSLQSALDKAGIR
ncbi:MAG TPA: FMN-binding protein [Jatrophihabitans sp.]|nr:FMN-binding protein [Jatrophihabitans sp.]